MRLPFKKILVVLFIVSAAAAGYYFLSTQENVSFEIPGLNKTISLRSSDLAALTQTTTEQFQILSSRSGDVGQNVEKVLGTAIEADTSSNQSITERAMEYGRYLYCQQVVEDYETQQSKE